MTDAWYSLSWFMPSTFEAFDWEQKFYIYCLPIVLLLFIVRWLWRFFFNQKLPVAMVQRALKTSPAAWLRLVPEILFMLVLVLVMVALARPQKTNEKVEQFTEGIDIMLTLDISHSMQFEDFQPNRLEAAKQVARNFVKGRKQDRIGLVVFSGDAYSLSPLTTDYELLFAYLDDVNFEMIENRGTAIGSALAVATNRMRESESKSKVCILISDGENTAGNIDPITAAELAAAYNIKIYSIAVGKEGMLPMGKDLFGRPMMVPSSLDETTLRKISDIGGGQFFRVGDNEALKNVFAKIDQYEKAEIKETRYKDTSDYYHIYLMWAMVILLLWLLTKSTFLANALQD